MPAGAAGRRAPVVDRVRAAVAAALAPHANVVLALSGGRDSTVLLDAVVAVAPERVRLAAVYDHGTGPDATRAAHHARALARGAGVPVVVGRGRAQAGATEAAWRAARWRFLRRAVRRGGGDAAVATGHTADDQLETVVMRLLRGAGARGLAAMYAPRAGVVRPLLDVTADEVAAYAAARKLVWVEDPSNGSRRHLRNRVRHDLLPALLRACPALGAELLADARHAAAWRAEVDAVADALGAAAERSGQPHPAWGAGGGVPVAPLAALAGLPAEALAALWPALAARAGVRLDRRGTTRLALFTSECVASLGHHRPAPGAATRRPLTGSATVAGGARVVVERGGAGGSPEWAMVVRSADAHRPVAGGAEVVRLDAASGRGVRLGRWRVRTLRRAPTAAELDGGWVAWLEAGRRYAVRGWQPGDRWQPAAGVAARRVKRFLADRHVPAAARGGWPVVVDFTDPGGSPAARGAPGGQIVWVPGVRRSSAAPARPGQPGFYLLCELTPERRRARL